MFHSAAQQYLPTKETCVLQSFFDATTYWDIIKKLLIKACLA